jgi:hypothetical protein
MMKKCVRENLYLGLYAHELGDYLYQLVKDVIFNKICERIAKPRKTRKANIKSQ